MMRVEIRKQQDKYAAHLIAASESKLVCLTSNLSQARREAASIAKAHSVPCINLVPEPSMGEMFRAKALWEFSKVAGL